MPDYTRVGNQDFGGNSRIIGLPQAIAAGQPAIFEQLPVSQLYIPDRDYSIAEVAIAPTTIAGAANTVRAFPWLVKKNITISDARVEVLTALAGSTFRVGLYSDLNGYPNALIAGSDVATIDSGVIGVKLSTYATPIFLPAGIYWQVITFSGTPTFRAIPASGLSTMLGVNPAGGTALNYVGFSRTLAYAALPANFSAGAALLANSAATLVMYRIQ